VTAIRRQFVRPAYPADVAAAAGISFAVASLVRDLAGGGAPADDLMVYGGWGSYLVDVQSGAASPVSFVAGYGAVAWLPK